MQLRAVSLGHRFADRPYLFRGLDFILEAGHVYSLTGPSGSGKSTILSILAGWTNPTEGTIERRDIARTAWVFQNPHGVARRSALDHVMLPYLARGLSVNDAREHSHALLRAVALETVAAEQFRRLSGGEAQRLMLARGMATDPQLLLVDEPTAQLDQHTAKGVNNAISALRVDGTIVVVATHDPSTRDACTDHIDLVKVL